MLKHEGQFDWLSAVNPDELGPIFDAYHDAMVWMKNAHNRFRFVNRTFLLNFSLLHRGDILGKTDAALSPGHLNNHFLQDDPRVLAGTTVEARVELVGSSDGFAYWAETWKYPLRSPDGDIVAAMGMTRKLPEKGADSAFLVLDLAPVLQYMRDHPTKPVSNEYLARLANLSVRAFERKFKKHFHLAPNQFMNRVRITRAASDLINTHCPIADIANRYGFSDQSHFTREFRKRFSMPPRAYREHFRMIK